MHSHLLIFNPYSDRGRSGQKASDLRAIVNELGGAEWRGTEYPGHATEIAAQAAEWGFKTVVAMGGDGTIHEIANGLMKTEPSKRPRLGIVPIGSGNDFAHAAGIIPNMQEAMRRVYTGAPRAVDVGLIVDDHGRREYFTNTIGLGFDGAINIQSRKIRFVQGFMMYLVAVLQSIANNFQAMHMKIVMDNSTVEQGIVMLTIGNGPREGGGFLTTPEARVNDGQLDYVYIGAVSQFRMLQLVPTVMNGTHVKQPEVKVGRSTKFVVTSDRAIPIHTDGELFAPYEANVRQVEINVIPQALQVIA